MGIKYLNRFMRSNCQSNIKQISLYDLRDKTIAIDASIYLYRFKADNCLIEGMYQMIGLMRHYRVRPLFVFDGKPPPEKNEVLRKRREEKKNAERKYNEAKERLKDYDTNEDTADLEAEIDKLRRNFIRITQTDVDSVKTLMRLMGAAYYDAPGESDGICARLVQRKVAYACMSEDMDMFAYGCPRVLRYMSLLHGTVVLYDLKGILNTLKISIDDFKKICILAGTDYNSSEGQYFDLNKVIKLYSKFTKDKTSTEFYEWVSKNVSTVDYDSLKNCHNMFDTVLHPIMRSKLIYTPYDKINLHKHLRNYGFVFA